MAEKITLHNGDSAEVLKQYPDNHFDSIVTDPPYGIEFLGKDWDKNTGPIEVWKECLRVLKPGGHILAFSAARTYHRLATNLEDIGFEIRDQIMWIYGSGFPKGQDMGKLIEKREGKRGNGGSKKLHIQADPAETGNVCKTCNRRNTPLNIVNQCQIEGCDMKERIKPADNEYAGWKTGLKPAHEPVVMAQKPYKRKIYFDQAPVEVEGAGQTRVQRCVKCHSSTGPIHKKCSDPECIRPWDESADNEYAGWKTGLKPAHEPIVMARKPFKGSTVDNVIKHGTGAINIDNTRVGGTKWNDAIDQNDTDRGGNANTSMYSSKLGRYPSNVIMSEEEGEDKEYNKYFYCPKVSRKERNIGCDMHEPITGKDIGPWSEEGERLAVKLDKMTTKHNNHPTVKPVALMKYLVTLVTPKGGKVLDPFNGSGSTGMAVKEFGGEYVGIDLDPNYIEIASKRIAAWK